MRKHVGGQAPQFLVDHRQQLVGSVLITAPNGMKDLGDLTHADDLITTCANLHANHAHSGWPTNFGRTELPLAARAAEMALDWIYTQPSGENPPPAEE